MVARARHTSEVFPYGNHDDTFLGELADDVEPSPSAADTVSSSSFRGQVFLLKGQWDVGAGVLFSLSTIKPQLIGPLVISLLHSTILTTGGASLYRFLPPHRFFSFALNGCFLDGFLDGRWLGMAVMVAVAACSASILWRLRRCDIASSNFGIAISLTLAATVSLLPTQPEMMYNQVLLLPAFLVLINARAANYYSDLARRVSVAFLACTFGATILAAFGESIWHPSPFWDSRPFQIHLLPVPAATALMMMTVLRPDRSYLPVLTPLPNSPSVSDLALVDLAEHRSEKFPWQTTHVRHSFLVYASGCCCSLFPTDMVVRVGKVSQ